MSDEHDVLPLDELAHYGILRKSGRYPWGSGANPYQRSLSFRGSVEKLRAEGLTDQQIADGLGLGTTTKLRDNIRISNAEIRAAEAAQARKLKDKGWSNVAIGNRMGKNESSVRSLLNPSIKDRKRVLESTTNILRDQLKKHTYLDVGKGTQNHMGISTETLNTALSILKDEGYEIHSVRVPQAGMPGNFTEIKTLAPPGTTRADVGANKDQIGTIAAYTENGGRSYEEILPPKSVSSDRIMVRYGSDGGAEKDGLIELRRGVDDIDLQGSRYAQVRIAVDDTHYLKGVAVHSDNMPKGVDIIYNVPKEKGLAKSEYFKDMKSESENPFGAVFRQRKYVDADGNEQLSALNIVNEEGDWFNWSKTLSSQMLSKQEPALAKKQLDLTAQIMQENLDEINSLTNPTVKKKLLQTFSDEADAAAAHLKAASLPGTQNHVLIPVPEMKSTEIYAPNYKDGQRVALIRHPHGGIFEIPELTVNNRQPQAKRILGQARDAVAINHEVAQVLSGADFDGDTVLVIPTDGRLIKRSKPLKGLEGFDPQTAYPGYEGMKVMNNTQAQMGAVSNLITDMSLRGATNSELARAVRHSMVVIDAEKHGLNYKQSEIDNGIRELKTKYQGGPMAGASTLISRAGATVRVPEIKPRSMRDGGPIDPKTGELVYVETGRTYPTTKTYKRTGETVTVENPHLTKVKGMSTVRDAHDLSSGTVREQIYADHANKLKAMANSARKEYLATPNLKYSPSAKKAYSPQVATLKAALNTAQKNAPLERQAQLIADTIVRVQRQDNPNMDADTLKKVKNQALNTARSRTGAAKELIDISPKEWEAIQAGAISNHFLEEILRNTDVQKVKELATPRTNVGLSNAKLSRVRSLFNAGYTQAEIAEQLGVSSSAIQNALYGKEK